MGWVDVVLLKTITVELNKPDICIIKRFDHLRNKCDDFLSQITMSVIGKCMEAKLEATFFFIEPFMCCFNNSSFVQVEILEYLSQKVATLTRDFQIVAITV